MGMVLPLAIGGACVVTSIIGTYFVRLGSDKNIMGALYKGVIAPACSRSWPCCRCWPSSSAIYQCRLRGHRQDLHPVEPLLVRR